MQLIGLAIIEKKKIGSAERPNWDKSKKTSWAPDQAYKFSTIKLVKF